MIAMVVALLVTGMGAAARAAWITTSSSEARNRLEPRFRSRSAGGRWRRPPEWVVAHGDKAGLRTEVIESTWPAMVVLTLSFVVVSTALFEVPGLVVAMLLVGAGPTLVLGTLSARVRERRARALPALLEQVARALRSGASLRQALQFGLDRADDTLAPGLTSVCNAVAGGDSLESALERWRERQPSDGLALAVAALTLGIDAGGAHGWALDGVAATLRDRLAMDRELGALSSQARASAAVMVVAPVLFAVFAAAADARTAHFLAGSATGWACLAAGLMLDGTAAFWMLRLTRGVQCSA